MRELEDGRLPLGACSLPGSWLLAPFLLEGFGDFVGTGGSYTTKPFPPFTSIRPAPPGQGALHVGADLTQPLCPLSSPDPSFRVLKFFSPPVLHLPGPHRSGAQSSNSLNLLLTGLPHQTTLALLAIPSCHSVVQNQLLTLTSSASTFVSFP